MSAEHVIGLVLGVAGIALFAAGFVLSVLGNEGRRRWWAESRGYFWMPCPSCGEFFGGNEWLRRGEHENSIPDGPPRFSGSGGQVRSGKGICPSCTKAGVGDRAWAEWERKYAS